MEPLKQWLSAQHGRGAALARHLGVPASFVSKIAAGDKPVPVEHGAQIECFTEGAVTRRAMFPDTCERIWPELAIAPAANDTNAAQAAEQGAANA